LQSRFIARLIEEKAPLEAEWWLLRQARSSNRAESAAAWLQLAELMQRLDRPNDAASCYRRLAHDFGDQSLPGGQTYKQLLESLPAQSPVRPYLAPLEQWPKYAAAEKPLSRNLTFTGAPLEISFGREPFFEHGAIELESNRRELLVRDGFGNERFRTELAENRRAARSVNYSSLPWARANGHILLIQERTQILAIDTLSSDRSGASRVLWRHDLADMIADESGIMIRPAPAAANRRVRPQWFEQRGRPVGGIWPVGHELICLQRGQKLVGIDVLSGEIVWTRNDIPPAEEIFGGEEHLFVVAPGSNEAIVLRTIDGAKAGTRPNSWNERYLTYGQKVVSNASANGKMQVRVYDVWMEEELWRGTFAGAARIEPIGSDEFAVMDSSGKLVIYSLHNAQLVVETQVEGEKALADLQVFRTADRYVVLAGRHVQYSQGAAHRYAVQNPGARAQPVIDSRAYAFDRRTGKHLWGPHDLPTTATLLNQPAHVPVLVFAMNVNDQSRANSARVQTKVTCLDVRNGAVLCNENLPGGSTTVFAVADPERKKLEIRCNSMTAVLAFSDTKADEKRGESAEQSEDAKADKSGEDAPANSNRESSPPPAPTPDPFGNPFERK
jgi:outer membrane protein assembly factor BamB